MGKKKRLKEQTGIDPDASWTATGAARHLARFHSAVAEPHPVLAAVLPQIHLGHSDDVERLVADADPAEAARRRQMLPTGSGLSFEQWHTELAALRDEVTTQRATADLDQRHRLMAEMHRPLTGRPYPPNTELYVPDRAAAGPDGQHPPAHARQITLALSGPDLDVEERPLGSRGASVHAET